MIDADVLAVASAAIKEFGSDATRIMERRAEAHQRAKESEGEEFWRKVAETVRRVSAESR